jgi:hypothetical protein
MVRRTLLVLSVAVLMVAMMVVTALPAFAQVGGSPGCPHFLDNAEANAEPLQTGGPAYAAFTKQLANIGGIGPCHAPHPGGR